MREIFGELFFSIVVLGVLAYFNVIPVLPSAFPDIPHLPYVLPPASLLTAYLLWIRLSLDHRPDSIIEYIRISRAFVVNVSILLWAIMLLPPLTVCLVSGASIAFALGIPVLLCVAVWRMICGSSRPSRETGWRDDVRLDRDRQPLFWHNRGVPRVPIVRFGRH